MFKKIMTVVLSVFMVFSSVFILDSKPVSADELVNLAVGKVAKADSEASTITADKAIDGKMDTRWGSSFGKNTKVFEIDLIKEYPISKFGIEWERKNVLDYRIEISKDNKTWSKVVDEKTAPADFREEFVFVETDARYIKLTVDDFNPKTEDRDGKIVDWATISIFEFEVWGIDKPIDVPVPLEDNIALNKPATASDVEAAKFSASKAFDGIVNRDGAKDSRWASNTNNGAKWLQVDLGKSFDLKTFVINWERRNANDFEIQTSDNGTDWTTVKHVTDQPTQFITRFVLDEAVQGRYVRLKINSFDKLSEGIDWNTVSVYEFEVYQGDVDLSEEEIIQQLEMPKQTLDDSKLVLPTIPGYEVTLEGVDYNYVVSEDGTIFRPLVDTEVEVSVRVKGTKLDRVSDNLKVVIPGKYNKAESINNKPVVIPELREWYGHEGNIVINESSRLVLDNSITAEQAKVADEFNKDFEAITGYKLEIVKGTPQAGDIFFKIDNGAWYGEEGYNLEIADFVTVSSNHYKGLFWSTRSLLQIIKTEDNVLPKGMARDYPRWSVRGMMLDVGRKQISFDFLEQITKQMSWYKLNDFQVHLNDNYIFLEDYTKAGEDPFDAYAGFRLESEIEGLTSEDTFYTKDEFRNFIKESRSIGVEIVPEIDVPAHSLAFTKIRKDLAMGNVGREADHLDLTNPETLPFVKNVFDEYLLGDNPVFDKDTIVNVGTDEYDARYTEEFRQFTDDMIGYVQEDRDRKVRLWGSLSARPGSTQVRSKDVQMNIWNAGWANPKEMYNDGFDLINMLDGQLYIVPDAGYYYDYLNIQHLYNNWNPNNFGGTVLPSGSDQVLGGAYALWNDQIDKRNNGTSEQDVYIRLNHAMPTMAEKLWGKGEDKTFAELQSQVDRLGETPNTNLHHHVDSKSDNIVTYDFKGDKNLDKSGNNYNLVEQENVSISNGKLTLNGNKSYVKNELSDIGLGNSLQFKIMKTNDDANSEQIIFENGWTQIKANHNKSGKLGFTREGDEFTFNYALPLNEEVDISITTAQDRTKLFVNGVLKDELFRDKGTPGTSNTKNASLLLPLGTIGSETDAFEGEISLIKVLKGEVTNITYVDKYELIELLDSTLDLAKKEYTNKSWDALQLVIKDAQTLINNESATQDEVDACVPVLTQAIKDLKKLEVRELKEEIVVIKELDASDYTQSSWAMLDAAIKEAQTVLDNEDATQAQIDEALANIISLKAKLVSKSEVYDQITFNKKLTIEVNENTTEQDFIDALEIVSPEPIKVTSDFADVVDLSVSGNYKVTVTIVLDESIGRLRTNKGLVVEVDLKVEVKDQGTSIKPTPKPKPNEEKPEDKKPVVPEDKKPSGVKDVVKGNGKDDAVNTGVITNYQTYVALIVVAGLALIVLKRRKQTVK